MSARGGRDLAATRKAILDAAETLFADRGYEATTIQQVAAAAGVSRGMPGYVFGAKEELYLAVLEQAFREPRALVGDMAARVGSDGPEQALRAVIGTYIDFLARRPGYVRLMARAALEAPGRLGCSQPHLEALGALLAAVRDVADAVGGAGGGTDPSRLVVDILALCFFPFAHRHTLLRPLGLDPDDPAFIAEHRDHVTEMVLRSLRAGSEDDAY